MFTAWVGVARSQISCLGTIRECKVQIRECEVQIMWLAMSTVTDAISCPRKFDCNESLTSFDIGPAPSYITIVSSILSCLGSILIVAAYFVLKDMRTGAQKIITLLAIADFISAAGYIFGSINFLTHFNHTDKNKCEIFQMLCEIQASITSWSSIASFCWTLILAFYFLMVIVYNRAPLAISLLPLYNLIAWGFPIFVIIPLAALRKLGYAPYAASNWCYVKDERYSTELENNKEIILFVFVAGKMWEILTYIVVTVIYIVIKIHFDKVCVVQSPWCSPAGGGAYLLGVLLQGGGGGHCVFKFKLFSSLP